MRLKRIAKNIERDRFAAVMGYLFLVICSEGRDKSSYKEQELVDLTNLVSCRHTIGLKGLIVFIKAQAFHFPITNNQ